MIAANRSYCLAVFGFLALAALQIAVAQPTVAQDESPLTVAPGDPPSQPSPQPPAPPKVAAGPAPLEASPLDTYLLRDSKGNLVPVLDWPFEDFEQLMRIKRGLAPPPPPNFSLDALSFSGSVNDSLADVQATATIRVRESGWIRVPLKLGKAVLREPARYQGPGEHLLTYDGAAREYVVWLKGSGEKPHVVSLQLSLPVTKSGGQSRVALGIPRATESAFKLVVPVPDAEAAILSGEGIVTSNPKAGEKTEIVLLGAAGELQLAWEQGQQAASAGPTTLESSADIIVKVEGENRISSDARIRIRSFGGRSVDAFRIRLPPGMELVPTSPVGYSLNVVSPPNDAPPVGKQPRIGQEVEVKLDRPTATLVEVRLLAAVLPEAGPGALQPARFEVLGAVRQRGTIDFVVEGEWQLEWKEDNSVRRLDTTSDAASALLAARYEFYRQPCGLSLKVTSKPSRITVEPTHIVYIDSQQARISTTLRYRLRGARSSGLEFELPGWTFDRLTPSDLFELPEPPAEGTSLFQAPFRIGMAIPADLELELEAHQPLSLENGKLTLTLPRPIANIVTPATVMMVPADNVEITPDFASIQGLTLDPTQGTVRIANRQQAPLAFRDIGGGEPAVFAATVQVRSRYTTASGRASVRFDQQQMHIEQRLQYLIAFEPQRTFELIVPHGVPTAGNLQVTLGSEVLTPMPATSPSAADESTVSEETGSGASRLQVTASTDQIGPCQMVIKYSLPLPKWDRRKPIVIPVPLVTPAEADHQQIGGQRIEFLSSEPWQFEPDPSVGNEFSRPSATESSGEQMAFAWARMTPVSKWVVQQAQGNQTTAVKLHKVWLQTWLAAPARQERAVFRISTDQDSIRIRLPAPPTAGSLQAAVNAQPLTATIRDPATVRVELPVEARGKESVIELWYSLPVPSDRGGLTNNLLRPPVVEGASAPRRIFWQLGLPEHDQVLLEPTMLASEMVWSTDSWWWKRQPTMTQQELESWIGASRQDPLPRGVNEYLYSALGRMPALQFTGARQRALLIVASGLILCLGLLLLHWQLARKPETLLVGAVLLASLALAMPEAALVIARSGFVGLVVALAVALWSWASSGRTIWRTSPASARRVPSLEARSTEAALARTDRAPPMTTTATAAAVGAGDSKA